MTRVIKRKKEIALEDPDISTIGTILMQGAEASIEDKIRAYYSLWDIIVRFSLAADNLKENIESMSLKDIQTALVAKSLLDDADECPVFNIGGRVMASLVSKTDTKFTIESKKLAGMDSLIPAKYKKVVVSYDKKALEQAYTDGSLEALLKPFVSMSSKIVTRMTPDPSKIKPKDATEEATE